MATSVTKWKREQGVRLLHNSDIQPNAIVVKRTEFVAEEFAAKNAKKILKEGDVITVHTGDVGTSAVVSTDYAGAIGFTTLTARVNDTSLILPDFLAHVLNSSVAKVQIVGMTISDRNNLNQKQYDKIRIPLPSLEKQAEIVAMLDKFDALLNDLSAGLPAELEARRKQYEHYRDVLVGFPEKQ